MLFDVSSGTIEAVYKGTDTQMHPNVAPKPKPPPQTMKPKPSLPKKPAVASKPTSKILEKNLSQNGSDISESQTHKPDVPEKVASADQSSPSQKAAALRPKEPPPPLPKTAPKGSVVHKTPPTIHKTPPPDRKTSNPVHKTPPPLPKTTPRSSVKLKEGSPDLKKKNDKSRSSNIGTNSDAVENIQINNAEIVSGEESKHEKEDFTFSNLKSKFINSSENIAKVAPKVATKPKPVPKGKQKAISDTKSVNQTEDEKPVNKNGLNIKSGNSKSKWFVSDSSADNENDLHQTAENSESAIQFLKGNKSFSDSTVWFNKSDESPKHSPKHSPVVPRKPPPRTPPKPSLSHSKEDISISNENFSSSSDNSPIKQQEKLFDTRGSSTPPKLNLTHSREDISNANEIFSSSCDNSPIKQQEKLVDTRGKSTPPKPNLTHSREDISNAIESFSSSGDKSPIKQQDSRGKGNTEDKCTFQKQSEVDVDNEDNDKCVLGSEENTKPEIQNIQNIESSEDKPKCKGSPKPPPKPVPRRPTPSVRPRPTPRKRLSINRLSGSDETFGTDSENSEKYSDGNRITDDEITDKNELEINEGIKNNSDIKKDHLGQDKENNVNVDLSDRNDSDVTLRRFVDDSGEEQHYRAIDKRKTKSHITELENETDENTVILREKITREESISEEITMEQLKSIEHLLEASDDEDDTHKFVPKVDLPVTDLGQKKTEKLEVMDGKNKRQAYEVASDDSDELDDKALLEPSSLLNEIEDILTRSFKHSSLTRSGSSPEKKSSPYLQTDSEALGRTERSMSVDADTPMRPPRPKKEQKKMRSMSQVTSMYDSCGSDTESLPDMSRNRDLSFCSNDANVSLTLGKAKPHPPKPKRNKLLKVQRSQSDITAMKSVVDSKSPNRERMVSEKHNTKNKNDSPKKGDGSPRQVSWRKNRPTRKAPPPPQKVPPLKVTPASPGITLDSVVPLDSRVKSMQITKTSNSAKDKTAFHNSVGPFYHSIDDGEVGLSDGEHDYQDIPDDNDKNSNIKYGEMVKGNMSQREKSASPPKLPPRNLSNSHSFDNSSMSSAGHEFDSAITGGASSTEDMSISSGCFEQDVTSPGFKNHHIMKSLYPKTSSPCVKNRQHTGSDENMLSSGLGPSNSSLSDSTEDKKRRPVSGCSIQSDSWSGSHEAEQSSSDSDLDDEEKVTRKKEKKLFLIAQEIVSSENVFVDVLKLLNVDFRLHISKATEKIGRPVIPNEILNRILDYLPQLQIFNEGLLKDLEDRLKTWEERKGIADIFVKKGPFLKLFSSYIRDFETITATYDDALKKYSQFQTATKEFELSPRCASLALKHYMLKPIQRIPQYRLLLQDYMKHLPPDCPEMKDMQTALAIVSEVALHANENMRHEDYVQKMLEIQRSLIGQFEVIKPGRIFLKEGELMKLSRKGMQPRYFFLFNDVLLYTTPVATGYRLNNVLPLAGMKVSVAAQDEYKMEFSIISVQRSFTLHGSTLEERDDWVTALNAAIEENALKRNTFEAVRAGAQDFDKFKALLDKDFVLGHKAPLWIPDARVTMCMLCTCEFTVTWRRHHCRACGWVVCGNCSDCKAPLRYLKYKSVRVCDKCYKTLKAAAESDAKSPEKQEELEKVEEEGGNLLSLNGLFERFQKIRRSGRTEKKMGVRPERLKEVAANDQGASMSGYLQRWHKNKKWKRKWYLIKDMVLYSFKATQDTAAADSMVLLGYEVSRFTDYFEGVEADLLFQLSHANTDPIVFRTDSATATEKWVTVMREATVA
ncbi:FYVE, RhoGEF and PH domain-containing protein 6-like isoform X2 [Ruditapes philippinarum]|uniref:FYVE, RhoGEF and PH domain-containing protein 6-like isoform X2 n=1 Tax=Ruditapes philippinarum TaxID=129788 RepID=UPI00295B7667|nr:FYVE, RhoGEF and PH domain-containing protein 6-like isoform X2 [Ruditapes philippinarum]